ncbi:MAG: hypothetical protein F6K19_38730 [Cyanothece sp. SIO1E1]|nr:hypothetical protein [Cyanothece sp. SIO1E1]
MNDGIPAVLASPLKDIQLLKGQSFFKFKLVLAIAEIFNDISSLVSSHHKDIIAPTTKEKITPLAA